MLGCWHFPVMQCEFCAFPQWDAGGTSNGKQENYKLFRGRFDSFNFYWPFNILKIVGQIVFGENDIGLNVITRNMFGWIVLQLSVFHWFFDFWCFLCGVSVLKVKTSWCKFHCICSLPYRVTALSLFFFFSIFHLLQIPKSAGVVPLVIPLSSV